MTDEELQARLTLIALLPGESREREKMEYQLVLTLVVHQPQIALHYAYEWWGVPGKVVPVVQSIEDALALFPALQRSNRLALTTEWLEELLADESLSSALLAAPLQMISRADWPEDRLIQRVERQPTPELISVLAPLCLMPETPEGLRSRLLKVMARQPTEALKELSEHLGRTAIWFALAYSGMFVTQAKEVLGDTTATRILLRSVRETRVVLRLRTRRNCRMRWAPRVDTWLGTRPQTELYRALRKELS